MGNMSWDDIASSEKFRALSGEDQARVKSKWEGATSNDLDGVMAKRNNAVTEEPLTDLEQAKKSFNVRNKNEFHRAWDRGIDSAQGMGGGVVAAVGSLANKVTGSDVGTPVRDWGYSVFKKNEREARLNPKTSRDFMDIRGLGDLGDWFASVSGEMAPGALETGLSAMVGAAIGGATTAPAGGEGAVPGAIAGAVSKTGVKALLKKFVDYEIKRGVKKGIYRGMTKQAMERAASRKVAGSIALVASSGAKESGAMFSSDANKRGIENANPFTSLALGTISGGTELFSPLSKIAGQFSGVLSGTAKELTKEAQEKTINGMVNWLIRAGKEVPKSMGAEGIQEISQEFLSDVNEKINKIDAPESWKEKARRYVETFAAGAAGGSIFGVIGSHKSGQNIETVNKEPLEPTYVDGQLEYDEEVIQDLRNKIAINTNKSNALRGKEDIDVRQKEVNDQISFLRKELLKKNVDDEKSAELQSKLDNQLVKREALNKEQSQQELDAELTELQSGLRDQISAKKRFDDQEALDRAAFGDNKIADLDKTEILIAINNGTLTQKQWDRADKSEFSQAEIDDFSSRIQEKSDKDFIDKVNETGEIPKEVAIEPTEKPAEQSPEKPAEQPTGGTVDTTKPMDIPDEDLVVELQDSVNAQTKDSGVYTPSNMTVSIKRSSQDHITDRLADLFGIKIVRFKENNREAMPINGGFSPTNKSVLYINEDTENSADWVFGHEFTHSLKESNPEAFKDLMNVAGEGINEEAKAKYEQKWRDAAEREGVGEATDLVEEEMLANFVGDQFSSLKFWENLHTTNQSSFEKILNTLKEYVKKIISSKVSNDPISKDYYNNIDELQKTLADVTRYYIGETGAVDAVTEKYKGNVFTEGNGENRKTKINFDSGATISIREDENSIYIDSYSMLENEEDFIKPLIAIMKYAFDSKKNIVAKGQGKNPLFVDRMRFSGSSGNAYFFPLQGKNKGGIKGGTNINQVKPIEGETPKAKVLPDAEVSMIINGKRQTLPKFVQVMERQFKQARTKFRKAKRKWKGVRDKSQETDKSGKVYVGGSNSEEDFNRMVELREIKKELKDILDNAVSDAHKMTTKDAIILTEEMREIAGETTSESMEEKRKAFVKLDREFTTLDRINIDHFEKQVSETKENIARVKEAIASGDQKKQSEVAKSISGVRAPRIEKILENLEALLPKREKELKYWKEQKAKLPAMEEAKGEAEAEWLEEEAKYSYANKPSEEFEPDVEESDPVADALNQLAFLLQAEERAREEAYDSLEEYDDYIEIKNQIREGGFEGGQLAFLENRASMMESDGVRERHRVDARNVEIIQQKMNQLTGELTEETGRTPNQIAGDARDEMNRRNEELRKIEEETDKFADFQKFAKGEQVPSAENQPGSQAVVPPLAESDAPVPEQGQAKKPKKKPRKASLEEDGRTDFEKTIDEMVDTGNLMKELRDSNSKNDLKKIPSLGNRMRLLREQAERQAPEGVDVNQYVDNVMNGKPADTTPKPAPKPKPKDIASQSSSPREGVKEDSQPQKVSKKSKSDELSDLISEQKKDSKSTIIGTSGSAVVDNDGNITNYTPPSDIESEIKDSLDRPEIETNLEDKLDALYGELDSTNNAKKEKSIYKAITNVESQIADQEEKKNQFKFSRKENNYGLDVKDPNPEVEKQIQAAKIPPEPWFDKARTKAKDLVKASLSAHPELGPGKFGQLKEWLRLLKNSSRQGAYKAWTTVYSNVKDLDDYERQVFNRVLILTDILRDTKMDKDGFSLLDDGWLPFGFKRIADVKHSLRHFQGQARKSPRLMKALANRRSQLKVVQEQLVELGLQPERILQDQNYFHHQVLEALAREETFTMFNQQQSVKSKKRGWQKARTGNIEAYNTEYISSEYEMLSQAHEAIHAKQLKMKIKQQYDVFHSVVAKAKAQTEETGIKSEWSDHIPPGYDVFKPDPNMNWTSLFTVPEKALSKILEDGKIKMEDLVMGIAKLPDETWVVPIEIAKTLKEIQAPVAKETEIGAIRKSFVTAWKKWTLMNPYRFFRYSTNNMSGDMDACLAFDYKILGYSKQAYSDLLSEIKGTGQKMFGVQKFGKDIGQPVSDSLKLAHEHDVIGSGFTLHEIQDIDEDFKAIMEGPKPGLVHLPGRTFSWWMDNTRAINNFRENILRLSAFRYFQDRIASGDDHIYGASNPMEVADILDPTEKAARLSRDLLGDYGNMTKTGDWVRTNMVPFYSWMEINAPRYYWMMKNSRMEGSSTKNIAKKLSWKAAKTAGVTAGKFMMMSAMITMWNATFFGNEEKDLSKDQKRRMHMILGRNPDGTVRYLPLSGAFRDALSWFGGEDLEYDLADVMSGESSPMKKLKEARNSYINKWVSGTMPIQKTFVEAAMGRSMYPDVFNPRPIHSRMDHIFRTFSLEGISRRAMGIPTRGMGDEFSSRLWYSVDKGESAYFQTRSLVNDFIKENTVGERSASIPSTKTNALYYYKQALRYSDMKMAERYLQIYYDMGGDLSGVNMSVKAVEPTGGLPRKLRSKFYKSLTAEDKLKLNLASKWYKHSIVRRSKVATRKVKKRKRLKTRN